jgi:hypothetical protein
MGRRRQRDGFSAGLMALALILAAIGAPGSEPLRLAAVGGPAAACAVPASTPALGGSFIDPNWETWWSAADTVDIAGRLCQAGITDVILQQAADPDTNSINYPTTAGSLASLRYTGNDAIGNWLTALAAHPGMHLYLGLGLSSASWFTAAGNQPAFRQYLAAKLHLDQALATDITSRYGTRAGFTDVFAGWYLPDEIDAGTFVDAVLPQASTLATDLLGPLTAALHGLTPGKIVFTSPFYRADAVSVAAWTALWKTILNASVSAAGASGAVDAIAPQDGLGHGGGSATAPQLASWFAALATGIAQSSAAGRTKVWDNVETYRLEGGPSHYATTLDMVNAMRSASAHTVISKYISFTYAENQTQHVPLSNGYLGYVDGRLDQRRPATPGSLRVAASANRAAKTLTWSVASDPLGGSGVLAYRVFRDGRYATQLDNPAQTSFTDSGLTPGRHTWTIAAVDGAGNQSAASPAVTTTVASQTSPDLTLRARYWFAGTGPAAPYRDSCVATSAASACVGQLTGGHYGPSEPLSSQYPAMFTGYDGARGTLSVVVDLGQARTIREIDSQWLSWTAMGVWQPSTVALSVSTDARAWHLVSTQRPPARPVTPGTWPNYVPVAQQNFSSVYVARVLGLTGRYVRLVADNPHGSTCWTMVHSITVH